MMSNTMTFENRPHTALGFSGHNAKQEVIPRSKLGQKRQNSIVKRLCKIGAWRNITKFSL